jgi:hypothetical protein
VRWITGGGRAGCKGGAEVGQHPGEETEGEELVRSWAEVVGATPAGRSFRARVERAVVSIPAWLFRVLAEMPSSQLVLGVPSLCWPGRRGDLVTTFIVTPPNIF